MRIRPRRLRLTVEQISFPLGVHMRQISFARAKKVSEIKHVYEVRPRKDRCGVDLISDALPFGRLWYGEANAASNAVSYAMHYSRSHAAVIRVYDAGSQRDRDAPAQGRVQVAEPSFTIREGQFLFEHDGVLQLLQDFLKTRVAPQWIPIWQQF